MEKAIAYLRVSTKEQLLGHSLDAQLEQIKRYASFQNLEIVQVLREEGVSGTKEFTQRPEGNKAIELLNSKQAKHIIALKLDRLFRNTMDALMTVSQWEEQRISLHLVDMGGTSINSGSAVGKMFMTMLAGFAQFERDLTAERITATLRMKKANKESYGQTPYGFHVEDGKLFQVEEEIKVVNQILKWSNEGLSAERIAGLLNGTGIPTKKGGDKWYPSTVRRILSNSIYREN